MECSTNPRMVIILSGKRKSGKDHLSELLANYINTKGANQLAVLRIAGPIKKEFANQNELDFGRLLDSSEYKENYRCAMVDWSERYRAAKGWNCFLEQAIREQAGSQRAIWILNDARRPCDVEYFDDDGGLSSKARIIKLRIEASDEARAQRGWKFVQGIDDRDTECGLDKYHNWTLIIKNNSNRKDDGPDPLMRALEPVYDAIDEVLL